MPTFKSGAFVQQCFAVHPLSLAVKAVSMPDRIVVNCTNCHIRHRVMIGTLTTRVAEAEGPDSEAAKHLSTCTAGHPEELRVSAVDVVQDLVKIRCAACRRIYNIAVVSFESYQKEM
jgi:hypothetical protein